MMHNNKDNNFGFLYLNELHYGQNPQPVYSLDHQILGYVDDDLKHNHHFLSQILQAGQQAFQTQTDDVLLRKNHLRKLGELLLNHQHELATIMAQEIGKRYSDCVAEIKRSVQYLTDTIRYYDLVFQTKTVIDDENWTHNFHKKGIFVKEPLGVVLGIVPFNFPINLLMTKLVPAYLVGNAVIIKGSHQAQLTTSYVANLVYQAGIRNNMVQIINIEGSEDLYHNEIVKMITFTGSSKVGNLIAQTVSKTKLVLEMGGKDCCLVLDDADLEACANDIIKGAFSYNGQRCTAIKKVLVSQHNHDKLVKLLLTKIKHLKVGPALDDCEITPMIDHKSINYLSGLVNDALTKGATALPDFKTDDLYVYPCLIVHVNNDMEIVWQEQFGPILPIQIYDDVTQAIQVINQSEYGLQASIYCHQEADFLKYAAFIECGSVNWNGITSRGPDIFPFSGIKESGFGTQGIGEALESMVKTKGYILNK